MDYWSNPKNVAGRLQHRIDQIKSGSEVSGTATFLKEHAAKMEDAKVQELLAELNSIDGSFSIDNLLDVLNP